LEFLGYGFQSGLNSMQGLGLFGDLGSVIRDDLDEHPAQKK
jgi:hypothetical protein